MTGVRLFAALCAAEARHRQMPRNAEDAFYTPAQLAYHRRRRALERFVPGGFVLFHEHADALSYPARDACPAPG